MSTFFRVTLAVTMIALGLASQFGMSGTAFGSWPLLSHRAPLARGAITTLLAALFVPSEVPQRR